MTAFAANSIFCRLALERPDIDAAAFTAVRLLSGSALLLVIARASGRRRTRGSIGDWSSGTALFAYAILFSFAYLRLEVGAGALILFASVQLTMILAGVRRGERPPPLHWLGLTAASGGLVYLFAPGLSAPSPAGSAMMAGAGVAWGVYSLRGHGTKDPLVTTTDNFVRSVPLAVVAVAFFHRDLELSGRGVLLGIASGAFASALGYVVWYAALRGLSATRAASVQLTVPVIAAGGGVLLLGESVSIRLGVSAALILGGVGLTLVRGYAPASRSR